MKSWYKLLYQGGEVGLDFLYLGGRTWYKRLYLGGEIGLDFLYLGGEAGANGPQIERSAAHKVFCQGGEGLGPGWELEPCNQD